MTENKNNPNPVTESNTVVEDKYEKLINSYLICREIMTCLIMFERLREQISSTCRIELFIIINNLLHDHIIINWAKIFGNKSEDLHVKKVFRNCCLSSDKVVNDFCREMGINSEEYKKFHSELLTQRNKLIAHFDINDVYNLEINMDFFKLIPKQCKSYISSIVECIREEGKDNPSKALFNKAAKCNMTLSDFANFVENDIDIYSKRISFEKWDRMIKILTE